MTYAGRVKKGVIILDGDAKLKDGTRVTVALAPDAPAAPTAKRKRKRSPLASLLLRHAGTVKGLPPDMSRNYRHYLYGAPRVNE